MKKILIIILCVFCLCGCSSKKEEISKTSNEIVSDNSKNESVQDEQMVEAQAAESQSIDETNATIDLSKAIIGEWYVITGEYGNQVLTFLEDGTYKEINDVINQTETNTGTYKISNDKLSIYCKTSSGSVINDENLDFSICGNVLYICDLGGLYCKMGETPNPTNKYTKELEGYYKDGESYYCFSANGEMKFTAGTNTQLYYYAANKDGFLAVIPAGASSGWINGSFELDDNENITKIGNIGYMPYYVAGKDSMTLEEISYEEYQDAVGNIPETHILLVTADALKARNVASTAGEKIAVYFKGRLLTSASIFETTKNEDYTWYKLRDGEYIADQNNQWIKVIR